MPVDPHARPRTKPAEVRRDDLMNAAERLFLENGVEETPIEQIARGAGVAKGTFYVYFSSKADVLEALRARFVQKMLDGIVAEIAGLCGGSWHEKLAAWALACAAGYLDAARLHHLVFVAAPPPTREGLTRNLLVDHLTELLAAGVREKAWSVDDPRFTSVLLFNALHGVVNQADIDGNEPGRDALLRALAAHFLRSVGPPGVRKD
jgi:AcrR family transcriptional regulator